MTKYSQTKAELIEHLKDQVNFMVASCISFDRGFEGEAKRLAVAIRILVHDTSSSSALLTQLGKMGMLFYDSASSFDINNILPSNCLTIQRISKKEGRDIVGEYVAPLDNLSPARSKDKKVGFHRWWKGNIILKDTKSSLFSRGDLILTVANKEGGAHIDPQLDKAYANLSRFNSLGWKVFAQEQSKDFENSPVLPSIRQIAHEIVKTLRDGCIDLFDENIQVSEIFKKYQDHCLTHQL
jgi:hypothetical protein